MRSFWRVISAGAFVTLTACAVPPGTPAPVTFTAGPSPSAPAAPTPALATVTAVPTASPTGAPRRPTPTAGAWAQGYDPGQPVYVDVWVDARNGADTADGRAPATALRTLAAAWRLIPVGQPLTVGYRIRLLPGDYPEETLPVYWESRYGTADAPILIQGQGDRPEAVMLRGHVNVFDTRYLYFENLAVQPPGDVFHCELCDHLWLKRVVMQSAGAWETVKVNQSQHVYLEDSVFEGGADNTLDMVAVQYGHVLNSRIAGAGDWCMYVKGGSAYWRIAGNVIHTCGTGGFTAGQGTGLQFMVPPWFQYEAYDVKVYHNVIYDTDGAGLGVNGGYNILLAHNTLYNVGRRSHVLEVVFGGRSCDGAPGDPGRERCQRYLDEGAWGTTAVDDGTNGVHIGNRNVFIYNNVVYNPPGTASRYQHFAIYAPRANEPASGLPLAVTDDNLRIQGNVIWNGAPDMPLGVGAETGCAPANPTCNPDQLRADNAINTLQPEFVNAPAGDFRPTGAWLTQWRVWPIPDFVWELERVPAGQVSNAVPGLPAVPGAFSAPP